MNKNSNKKYIKIIYFDEESATDYIYIINGGKSKVTAQDIVDKTNKLAADADARATAKFSLLSLFKINASAGTETGISREGKTIISRAVTSTILTDYLNLVDKCGDRTGITKFEDYTIYPYPDSISYYKMLTPYMIMTEGKVDIDSDIKINVSLMDKALESGRGYYELMAQKESNRCVLRFNIKAFRNNYTIADLIKMKLQYQAIEVGEIDEDSLKMEAEFSNSSKDLNGFDITNQETGDNTKLKVYDVFLAGICV